MKTPGRKCTLTHGSRRASSNVYCASESPSTQDLYWAAGFVNGEGTFAKPRGKYQSPRVCVCQVEKEPVAKLQAMFGGSLQQRQPSTNQRQPYWQWHITGPRARGVMMTLYALLSPAKQRDIQVSLGWSSAPNVSIF